MKRKQKWTSIKSTSIKLWAQIGMYKSRYIAINLGISSLNMIIVIIISVAALIIIIDTFRIELSKYIPFLNPMLDSFYAIITDINSFIKDLIR